MIRIAICDDEEIICSHIEKFIANTSNAMGIEVEIDIFSAVNHL